MSTVTDDAKNSQVCSHRKMRKILRSVVTNKCRKLVGQRAWKSAKTHRSAFTENAKNSQVRGHEKMTKTRRSAVMENFKNT